MHKELAEREFDDGMEALDPLHVLRVLTMFPHLDMPEPGARRDLHAAQALLFFSLLFCLENQSNLQSQIELVEGRIFFF